MPLQCVQTGLCLRIPHFDHKIICTTYNPSAIILNAPNCGDVAHQDVQALARLYVPHAQRRVSGTTDHSENDKTPPPLSTARKTATAVKLGHQWLLRFNSGHWRSQPPRFWCGGTFYWGGKWLECSSLLYSPPQDQSIWYNEQSVVKEALYSWTAKQSHEKFCGLLYLPMKAYEHGELQPVLWAFCFNNRVD